MSKFEIATFYKFMPIEQLDLHKETLLRMCQFHQLKGSIILATEGINSSLAGSESDVRSFIQWLEPYLSLDGVAIKYHSANVNPFRRLKVRIKKEIVTLKAPYPLKPDVATGIKIQPQDWNAFIANPEVILIDTRNHYETSIGHFPNALDPNTKEFSAFNDFVFHHLGDKKTVKIATYCTGGIRCEKATSFLLSLGFAHVYQLEGGILNYLQHSPLHENQWQGECFVFDKRVALKSDLSQGQANLCAICRQPYLNSNAATQIQAPTCPDCRTTLTLEDKPSTTHPTQLLAQKKSLGPSIE